MRMWKREWSFYWWQNVLIYRLITGQVTVTLCNCDRISLILLINYDQFRSQLYSSNTLAEKCGWDHKKMVNVPSHACLCINNLGLDQTRSCYKFILIGLILVGTHTIVIIHNSRFLVKRPKVGHFGENTFRY